MAHYGPVVDMPEGAHPMIETYRHLTTWPDLEDSLMYLDPDHRGNGLHVPENARTAVMFATSAMARQNWAEAFRMWDIAHGLDPSIDATRNQRGIAKLRIAEEAAALNVHAPVNIGSVENHAARDLLLKFESLGENCEFGLVQRRFEAEPIGFLRWTYTSAATLTKLLDARFEGIGEIETLKLTRAPWGEYFLKDQAYGVTFHTYLHDCGPDEELFLKKQSARLVWMKKKLIEDLESGAKTFVYKVHYQSSDDALVGIQSTMRTYGNNRLLCVRMAPEGTKPGSVAVGANGLVTGYLSRVEPSAGNSWDICYDEWLSICQVASDIL
jgi:hypothetical protein